jgi:thiol-disulfide isomerase/thioredoxin
VPPGEEKPVAAAQEEKEKQPVLIGPVTREQVEEAVPEWVQAEVEASPEPAAVQALASVPPGAEVTVFLGTWCGDSRREVSRLWKALDAAGGTVPFAISYIGIDEDKKEPAAQVGAAGIQYVPTLIVRRDGREVGRIVESAPHGVERDLAALLDGSAQGVVSDREDLRGPAGDTPQPQP